MRALHTVLIAVSIVATGPALAQPMADMPGMAGMDHAKQSVKTGKAVGVITAIDPKAAKVTIKHGPIPAVGWPAMTMTFNATPPTLLNGVRVGQTVAFDVHTQGMDAEVTALRPH